MGRQETDGRRGDNQRAIKVDGKKKKKNRKQWTIDSSSSSSAIVGGTIVILQLPASL